jgi:tyrosyl-tRNA synthetase
MLKCCRVSEQLRLDEELFFLDFIRDIGKHITVNYMMSKDSVKKRLSSEAAEGMSFTEFTINWFKDMTLHLYKK